MGLEIVPISLKEANAYVEQHHRHHKPVTGHKFSIGCSDGEKIVGVAIVGRPVSRYLDNGWHSEGGTQMLNKQNTNEDAEKHLEAMKREAVHMIKSTELQETRKAWYHSHLGSIDFARQMGLITEERRQQLYKEFKKEIAEG